MIPILVTPNPVLREIAKPVTKVDKKLLDLINQMRKALLAAKDPEGVGLAAPQVGVPLRLFLARPNFKKPPILFINPEIISYSQRQQTHNTRNGVYEGCLSIPHHYAPLKRSMAVTVKYQTIKSPPSPSEILIDKTENFSGFLAHIIQHEVDHLNGILFIDHVLSQNSKLFRIQGKDWEELSI